MRYEKRPKEKKTNNPIRKSIPQKLLRTVLIDLVLIHLHYSAVIFHAIEQNPIQSSE